MGECRPIQGPEGEPGPTGPTGATGEPGPTGPAGPADFSEAFHLENLSAGSTELFEWGDGNPYNENRRGYFVILDGEYIRKAAARDSNVLGIVKAAPSFIGDARCGWQGIYLRDAWGAVVCDWEEQRRRPARKAIT